MRARLLDAMRRGAAVIRVPVPKNLSWIQPVSAVVLALGSVVAVGGFFAINEYTAARLQRDFDRTSEKVTSILTKSIDRHIRIARSAGALFSGPNANVNRWTFFEFARDLPEKNPGLSAVEWIPRVSRRQRSRFEKKAGADGLFDFHFMQRAKDGRRVKAAARSHYFPVYYVEPYNGNESELGLDLAADSRGAAFLSRVRDSGRIAATHSDLMPAGATKNPGFSVVLPVYRSSVAPFTVRERRTALTGYVRARFRFDRLLEALRSGAAELPALEIYILEHDAGNNPSLINHFTSQPADRPARPVTASDAYRGIHADVEHEVAGQIWEIVVKPAAGVFQNTLGFTAWGFAAFTLLLTGLLLRYLSSMRRARDEAQAANRAKSEFLAMMSHELRTPLNAVIGFSEMMINEMFGPLSNTHYKEYTANINRSATHLLGLINSILDLSKAEAGKYELDPKDFALCDVWNAVLPALQAGIADAALTIDDGIAGSPLKLHGDPDVFRQILHNVVSNAITYTPRGGSVTVRAETDADGGLTLRVADTGIGIAEEDIELVLKPFRQADSSLARRYEGVGLGLPLTRMLVEIQGGTLGITSRLNEGTEVTVAFPAGIMVNDQETHGYSDGGCRAEETVAEGFADPAEPAKKRAGA